MTPAHLSWPYWILCLDTRALGAPRQLSGLRHGWRLVLFYSTHLTFHPGEDRLASVQLTLGPREHTVHSATVPPPCPPLICRREMGLQSRGTTGRGIHRAPPGTAFGVSLPPQGTGLAPQFWLPTRRVPAARPSGSLGRAAQSCAPLPVDLRTAGWRSTVAARTEAHSTLPGALGVTACVALPRAPFVVASSFCSTASPQSHAPWSLGTLALASRALVDCSMFRLPSMCCHCSLVACVIRRLLPYLFLCLPRHPFLVSFRCVWDTPWAGV